MRQEQHAVSCTTIFSYHTVGADSVCVSAQHIGQIRGVGHVTIYIQRNLLLVAAAFDDHNSNP